MAAGRGEAWERENATVSGGPPDGCSGAFIFELVVVSINACHCTSEARRGGAAACARSSHAVRTRVRVSAARGRAGRTVAGDDDFENCTEHRCRSLLAVVALVDFVSNSALRQRYVQTLGVSEQREQVRAGPLAAGRATGWCAREKGVL